MSLTSDPQDVCPPERVWDEIATGLLGGEQAVPLLEHASRCPNCAAALRSAIEIFADEIEPPVGAHGITPILQKPQRKFAVTSRPWSWAAAAVLVALAGTGYLYWQRSTDPLRLLARGYSAHRTLEMRLPGAAYGELRIERGATPGSLADQPPEFLEVAGRIQRALARNPNDAHWLWAKGRLALLEGHPEQAIESLQASLDWGRSSPDLLTDLAIAYQEKGRRDQAATDLNHAVELFGRAIQSDSRHAAALFNRALVEDELQETQAAIADLEKLLSIETSGAWAEEARTRLARLRAKKSAFLDRRPGEDLARFDEVALDAALVSGLGDPVTDSLASRLEQQHQDPWLRDLRNIPAAQSRAAIQVLARTSVIRLSVESGRYHDERAVDQLALSTLPPPVALWQAFEVLYRATHARGQFRCNDTEEPLIAKLLDRKYYWLAVQTMREAGYCRFQSGDIDAAEQYAQRSIALADQHTFPVASVRTQGLLAYVEWRRGHYRQAIEIAHQALILIQARRLPVARSQQFYAVLDTISEQLAWWNAACVAAAEMTEMAQAAGMRDLQYTNMVRWAQLELRCGNPSQARTLFQQTLTYYASLAPSDNRAWAEIGFAQASHDESRMLPFAADLERSHDSILFIPYQRVRSLFAIEQGRLADAQSRLDRIVSWLNTPEASHSPSSNQWHDELHDAGQLAVELALRQGRPADAYRVLQQFRAAEQRPLSPMAASARAGTKGTLVFSLARVWGRYGVWRLDQGVVDFRWAGADAAGVVRLSRCLHRLVASPESAVADIGKLSSRLRTVLFGSWLDAIAPDRVILIQTDEALIDTPFAVLPGKSEPLALEHPIAMTTLTLPDDFAAKHVTPHRTRILLVDASDLGYLWLQQLPALSGVKREISGIQNIAGFETDVIQGQALSVLDLASRVSSAGILHFAGHAVETSSGAAIVLPGSPTPVGLADLGRLGLRWPPIVVLAACSTGERTETDSFGPGSLAAAFLLEGSAEVIASLWNVNSESTADFMAAYYRGLASAGSGQALQSAMRSLRRSSRYSHPYYWATFARFIRA